MRWWLHGLQIRVWLNLKFQNIRSPSHFWDGFAILTYLTSKLANSFSSLAIVCSVFSMSCYKHWVSFFIVKHEWNSAIFTVGFRIFIVFKMWMTDIGLLIYCRQLFSSVVSFYIRFWIMLLSASGSFHLQMSRHEHYSIFFGSASFVRPLISGLCNIVAAFLTFYSLHCCNGRFLIYIIGFGGCQNGIGNSC